MSKSTALAKEYRLGELSEELRKEAAIRKAQAKELAGMRGYIATLEQLVASLEAELVEAQKTPLI